MCVYIAYNNLAISFGDKLGQHLTETLRISYDNPKVIVHFTTSLYKSHDARTMALRKSQGVGVLTVQLSCNYNVHGIKWPSMFIFGCTFELCFKVM